MFIKRFLVFEIILCISIAVFVACGVSTNSENALSKKKKIPSNLTYSTMVATYSRGIPIVNNIPKITGTVVTWSISPVLPGGLVFDVATGIISGTPSSVQATRNYIITAANSYGSTTVTISITINNGAPSNLTYSSMIVIYTKDTLIVNNIPTVTGVVTSWSIDVGLPSGLIFNTTTGVISGTPSIIQAAKNYTITAANSAGSTTATISITINAAGPSGIVFREIDGGPNYYSGFTNGAPLDSIFPIGAWLEQPTTAANVAIDIDAGLNVYFSLAGSPGDPANIRVDYDVIRNSGMMVFAPDITSKTGSETIGWFGVDEADMMYKAGFDAWQGRAWEIANNIIWGACIPTQDNGGKCGYTVLTWYTNQVAMDDGRLWYNGYGKNVLFWDTDVLASPYVNQYSDIIVADAYWFVDPDLNEASQGGCRILPLSTECAHWARISDAQRKLAANYAYNIQRLGALLAVPHSKPIYAYVELGSFATETITPAQIKAAVWHSIIAGARGIIYFNHSFYGVVTYNILYEGATTNGFYKPVRDMVKSVDAQITSLASVLLAPFAENYVTVSGTVMYMAKYFEKKYYIFAGSGKLGTPPIDNQVVIFTLADHYNGSVHVLDENRTIKATNGVFTDVFADANSIHIYMRDNSI